MPGVHGRLSLAPGAGTDLAGRWVETGPAVRAPAWIIPALVVACTAAGVGGSKLVVAPSLVREYAAGATQATAPTDARTSQFVV